MTDSPLLQIIHPEVREYIASLSFEGDPLIVRMAAFARSRRFPWLGHDAGRWLELLSAMIRAERAFEFGSGFGYSAYFLARGMGPTAQVHGSDIDAEMVDAHRELFAGHPYKPRITIHHGDGVEVLAGLPGSFDVVFIDMDKPGYPAALEAAIPRVRPGGLILADNVLWSGRTARPDECRDRDTLALRRYNEMVHADPRLRSGIIAVGDGLSVSLRV